MRKLYCLDRNAERISCECLVKSQRLSIFNLFIKGESKSLSGLLSRFMWCTATLGKARIYFIEQDNKILHTSLVVPSCKKFPFLNKNDYEIGPCFTEKSARGKGYYPQTLDFIVNDIKNADNFYMIVDDLNIASIKGIKKAGFKETEYCVVRSRLGIHKKEKIS